MSHPVFWPSKHFFYPIGNTAAFCLTQDLQPERATNVLLLGCGDPRNILFTLYADYVATLSPRKLDITCCDHEPAVLARNILLFSLLEDNESSDHIWAMFHHFKISDAATKLLVQQSQKLYESAQDLEAWRGCRYGSFISFVDARTLFEVRSYWGSYVQFPNISAGRQKKLAQDQARLRESVLKTYTHNTSASRSAGMLWHEAALPVANLFRRYWETGTMHTADSDVKQAKHLNPTFVYSVKGEVFDPHYGTFPQGFHLTAAFAPTVSGTQQSTSTGTASAVVNSMMEQFRQWADAFRVARAANAIVVRCYSGDALAFCRALDVFAATDKSATGVFVSSWRGSQISLEPTTTSFDVIDTSNLTDHLGLLNLLIATRPLLKEHPLSQSVLYTETLLPAGEDATKSFLDRICATVPTISALLGLAPRAYVSSFTTHSNTHELIQGNYANQYHERVAWVDPSSGDRHVARPREPLSFDPRDLARILFGFYNRMLPGEKVLTAAFANASAGQLKALSDISYDRETVAKLFQLVKRRVQPRSGTWSSLVEYFFQMVRDDPSRMVKMNLYQDLCLQLHLAGVYTDPMLKSDWDEAFGVGSLLDALVNQHSAPLMRCVVLTVPRSRLRVLLDDENVGMPTLQCDLTAQGLHSNSFSALQMAWGKVIVHPDSGDVSLEEDPKGMEGKSDLVVFFWASSLVLEFEDTFVALAIKSTPLTTMTFMRKLGMELAIFSARIDDVRHVRVVTRLPTLALQQPSSDQCSITRYPDPQSVDELSYVVANTGSGADSQSVVGFTSHIDIDSATEREALLSGTNVSASQIAPCTMKVSFGKHHHTVSYPYPILGSKHRLRVARKSHYIEVIVPISEPLDTGGYHLDPAPILRDGTNSPWNMHHVWLDRMPRLSLDKLKNLDVLNSHTALQLSDRERAVRESDEATQAAPEHTLVNVKSTIHALTMAVSGLQGPKSRVLGLSVPGQGGIYAILLVGSLRLDQASSTIIIDTALVPLSQKRMPHLLRSIQTLQSATPVVQITTVGHELVAWKKLLPAYVERCRTWTHKPNCEYATMGKIPLSLVIDENPICTCGEGIGFEGPEWKVGTWKGLLPYATRAAISPLFAVSYIESVAGKARSLMSGVETLSEGGREVREKQDKCWACGGGGKPNLSACSRCKKAKYCSATCQRRDWATHKVKCSTK